MQNLLKLQIITINKLSKSSKKVRNHLRFNNIFTKKEMIDWIYRKLDYRLNSADLKHYLGLYKSVSELECSSDYYIQFINNEPHILNPDELDDLYQFCLDLL